MIVNKYNKGGGGSGSGVTPEQVQAQIDSALTYYWESGITKEYVDSADTIIYASATSRMDDVEQVVSSALNEFHEQILEVSATTAGKADAASVTANTSYTMFPRWNNQGIVTGIQAQVFKNYLDVNDVGGPLTFYTNSTVYGTQEKALKFYAPVSAGTAGDILVSTGSGAPVWSAVTFPETKILVDFDKTPQSERAAIYAELKALYDGGSGSSINKLYDFYKTVNTWQGQKIDYYTFSGNTLVFGQVVSPENVTDQVVYVQVMEIDSAGNVNVVTNAIGASGGGVSQEYVDSAVTILQDQLNEIDEVIPAAIVDLNERVDEISAATPSIDLSGYYTSAQTEEAISAATSGKADAVNIQAHTGGIKFPLWNSQGIITGPALSSYWFDCDFKLNGSGNEQVIGRGTFSPFYAPLSAGTAGEILVSTGSGAPVWSAVTMGGVSQEYVDSATTILQDQIDIIDQVASAALVDLNEKKVESEDVKHMVKLTQAEYDQLSVKDPETFYIIVNE